MWIKAGVLGGIIFPNLSVWTMAGLGITLGFQACRKWVDRCNIKLGVVTTIDGLPDDVVLKIVSLLTTTEAARTSILSKRWRKMWTMNNRLVFSCLSSIDISKKYHDDVFVDLSDKLRFFKVVDECLRIYSGRKLKIFFMHCCFYKDHPSRLVQLMQDLASPRHDVELLYLGHSCPACVDFEGCTFSFKYIHGFSSLKYINLTRCYVRTSFVSPCFSLTRLDLSDLPLVNDELFDILLSCPNLSSLCVERCELPLNLRISGSNLKLKYLTLLGCYNVEKLEISDCHVMIMKIDIRNEVEIMLSSLPKLDRLEICTPSTNYCFRDVLRDLPHLKYLLVQTYYQIGGPVCKEERKEQWWPVLQHKHKHLMFTELSGFTNTRNELEFAELVLTLMLSSTIFTSERFLVEDEKSLKQMDDAQVVFANLQQRHASVSVGAKLKLSLFVTKFFFCFFILNKFLFK